MKIPHIAVFDTRFRGTPKVKFLSLQLNYVFVVASLCPVLPGTYLDNACQVTTWENFPITVSEGIS